MQPVVISEDEFEYVPAVFKKVTHKKTAFLHHVRVRLSRGVAHFTSQRVSSRFSLPAVADYHSTFATSLPPEMFALFAVPSWVPQAAQLLRCARAIYPHWRERREDRGGHRIYPLPMYVHALSIAQELQRQKEKGKSWEDVVDVRAQGLLQVNISNNLLL